jgi:hypothetical protein
MAMSAVAAGKALRSRSTLIIQAKDWQLYQFYEYEGDDAPLHLPQVLVKIGLPFNVTPEQMFSIPDEYTTGLQHYENTNDPDSVPWTGYYGNYQGARLAVTNTFGVWFKIEKAPKRWMAIQVVRAGIPIKHWPVEDIDFEHLEDTRDLIQPPPIAPQQKYGAYLHSIGIKPSTESEVEKDEDMKPMRSSQTERG